MFELQPYEDSEVESFIHRNQAIHSLFDAIEEVSPDRVCIDCPALDVAGMTNEFEDENGELVFFWDIINAGEFGKYFSDLTEHEAIQLWEKGRKGNPPIGQWCIEKFDSHAYWEVTPAEVAVLAEIVNSHSNLILAILGLDYRESLKQFCNFLTALQNEKNGFVVGSYLSVLFD